MNKTNIVFSGEGGQGIQTMAKIFSIACVDSGLEVSYLPSFGVEQRGTPSIAFITLDQKQLRYSKFPIADYAVILQNRAISAVSKFISPNTKVIFDSSTIAASDLPKTSVHVRGIPATKYASEKFNQKSFNIIFLGYFSKLFELSPDKTFDSIVSVLGKKFKNEETLNQTKEAFLFGREIVPEKDRFSKAIFKPKQKSVIYRGHDKHGEVLPSRCKGCGVCIVRCPVGALSFGEELGIFATPVPKVDLEKCIACGNCRNYCPDSAISIERAS